MSDHSNKDCLAELQNLFNHLAKKDPYQMYLFESFANKHPNGVIVIDSTGDKESPHELMLVANKKMVRYSKKKTIMFSR